MADSLQTLSLQGMSCMHCVRAVREALDAVPGVIVRDVQIGSATVEAAPEQRDALAHALAEAGYPLAEPAA